MTRHRAPPMLKRAVATAGLLMLALPAAAGLYKWTDANGTVHYTQSPPPQGPYQTMRPDAVVPPAPVPARDQAREFLDKAEKQRAESAKAREAEKAKQSARVEQCEQARERLRLLEERTPRRLAVQDDSGQLSRMTVEQWEQRKGEAQKQIAQSCG